MEFTVHRWIPRTKASDAELYVFLDLRLNERLSKQSLSRVGNNDTNQCNGITVLLIVALSRNETFYGCVYVIFITRGIH